MSVAQASDRLVVEALAQDMFSHTSRAVAHIAIVTTQGIHIWHALADRVHILGCRRRAGPSRGRPTARSGKSRPEPLVGSSRMGLITARHHADSLESAKGKHVSPRLAWVFGAVGGLMGVRPRPPAVCSALGPSCKQGSMSVRAPSRGQTMPTTSEQVTTDPPRLYLGKPPCHPSNRARSAHRGFPAARPG